MNKRLTTGMADANGLQRAIRPTRFFNIKKMALQHAMHNGQYWVFKVAYKNLPEVNTVKAIPVNGHLHCSNKQRLSQVQTLHF